MKLIAWRYGFVTVADLNYLRGVENNNYSNYKVGWTYGTILHAKVCIKKAKNGYIAYIDLPGTMMID